MLLPVNPERKPQNQKGFDEQRVVGWIGREKKMKMTCRNQKEVDIMAMMLVLPYGLILFF